MNGKQDALALAAQFDQVGIDFTLSLKVQPVGRLIEEEISKVNMALKDLSQRFAVLKAIQEYDQKGRDAFLREHGFGPARSYFLVYQGKRYDSKAIAGVAHGYQFPDKGPLHSWDFSGGENTVMAKLISLGFEVISI